LSGFFCTNGFFVCSSHAIKGIASRRREGSGGEGSRRSMGLAPRRRMISKTTLRNIHPLELSVAKISEKARRK